MTGMKNIALTLAAVSLLASSSAHANPTTLFDRGGGLIYDSVLNITWLQDANYAKTSGYDADGLMNWSAANAWAAGLSYFDSVRGVTYSDWRLPTTTDLGTPGCNLSYSGGTDCGFNVATSSSEMAHLFFVDLGNLSAFDTTGVFRGGSPGVDWGVVNTGPFQNLQPDVYWSSTAYVFAPPSAWDFGPDQGFQGLAQLNNDLFAWAVRDGDVAAIPEPMSVALLGLGLAAMAVARRRRTVGA